MAGPAGKAAATQDQVDPTGATGLPTDEGAVAPAKRSSGPVTPERIGPRVVPEAVSGTAAQRGGSGRGARREARALERPVPSAGS